MYLLVCEFKNLFLLLLHACNQTIKIYTYNNIKKYLAWSNLQGHLITFDKIRS